jgi:flagellar basal body-associated protein FliL
MFTKIDKKVLIILIIALIAILASVFLIYKYIGSSKNDVENTVGGSTEEQTNKENLSGDNNDDNLIPQIEIEAEGVANGSNNGGMLTVCVEKCGDGVCQETNEKCQNSLNCACPETSDKCPQDCK